MTLKICKVGIFDCKIIWACLYFSVNDVRSLFFATYMTVSEGVLNYYLLQFR